ncbi:hypothetical protein KUCAC02_013245, partial [Chaenocephalus aceratus]
PVIVLCTLEYTDSSLLKTIDGAHFEYVLKNHQALVSVMHLLPENVLISGNENIPGLATSPTGDALLRPQLLKMLPFTLNKLTISLQPSLEKFESQLLQLINADCHNTYETLNASNKAQRRDNDTMKKTLAEAQEKLVREADWQQKYIMAGHRRDGLEREHRKLSETVQLFQGKLTSQGELKKSYTTMEAVRKTLTSENITLRKRLNGLQKKCTAEEHLQEKVTAVQASNRGLERQVQEHQDQIKTVTDMLGLNSDLLLTNFQKQGPEGTLRAVVIQERRLHVGVHNGWCFLDKPQVVVLEPLARSRSDTSSKQSSLVKDSSTTSPPPQMLGLRSSLELKLTNHQALAIVFQLEFVFSAPIGRETM